jgi:hypothetical protein
MLSPLKGKLGQFLTEPCGEAMVLIADGWGYGVHTATLPHSVGTRQVDNAERVLGLAEDFVKTTISSSLLLP